MINPIKIKIRQSKQKSILHNSREDAEMLGKVCNELIDKVNELIVEVNKLKSEQK